MNSVGYESCTWPMNSAGYESCTWLMDSDGKYMKRRGTEARQFSMVFHWPMNFVGKYIERSGTEAQQSSRVMYLAHELRWQIHRPRMKTEARSFSRVLYLTHELHWQIRPTFGNRGSTILKSHVCLCLCEHEDRKIKGHLAIQPVGETLVCQPTIPDLSLPLLPLYYHFTTTLLHFTTKYWKLSFILLLTHLGLTLLPIYQPFTHFTTKF